MNDLVLYEPRIYKLYVHVNKINNKKYFGITKNDVHERWEKYGSGYKKKTHIRNAFDKYGWNNFEHFIILDLLTYNEALIYEKSFIHIFNTTNISCGYNKDKGGKDFLIRAEARKSMESRGLVKPVVHLETNTVYSDSNIASFHTGYKASSIRRTCNSKKYLLFNSHWMFKKDYDKLSENEINNILNIKPKNYMDDNRKVICLETLEVFKNAEEAQKVYSVTTETCIRSCCKHLDSNRITAGGQHWLYLSEYQKLSGEEIHKILGTKAGQKVSKAVIKLETLEIYPSIEDASAKTGISSKTIRYSCTGKQMTHPKKGHWMFKKDYDKATPEEIQERFKQKRVSCNRKKVRCIETGEVFNSIMEANEFVRGCPNNSLISKCCKDSNITYKGFHWEYMDK